MSSWAGEAKTNSALIISFTEKHYSCCPRTGLLGALGRRFESYRHNSKNLLFAIPEVLRALGLGRI